MKPLFENVLIVGCGLIGASVGLNLVGKGLAGHVTGVGRSRKNLEIALRRRAIHTSWIIKGPADLFRNRARRESWSAMDLILLAQPVSGIVDWMHFIPPSLIRVLKPACVVTDVGSTKGSIVSWGDRRLSSTIGFVGGHPIAGTEKGGAGHAARDLFEGRRVILTPTSKTRPAALSKVRRLWRAMGGRLLQMGPEEHDRLVAVISHLPHFAAFALVQTALAAMKRYGLTGGGLKDMTRIASSDPILWRDIALENKNEITKALVRYQRQLHWLSSAVRSRRGAALAHYFAGAKRARDRWR